MRVEARVRQVVDQRHEGGVAVTHQAAPQQVAPDATLLVVRAHAEVLHEGDRDPIRDDAGRADERRPVPGRDHERGVVEHVREPPVEARHLRVAPQRQEQVRHLLLRDRPALPDGHRAHLRPRVAASRCPVFPYSNAAVNRRPWVASEMGRRRRLMGGGTPPHDLLYTYCS